MKPHFNIIAILFLLGLSLTASAQKSNKYSGGDCIKGDCSDGFGVFVFSNNDRYEGDWKAGKKHGYGTYISASGHIYSGMYNNDKRNGYGTYKWPEGDMYIGEYVNDLRHGRGVYIDDKGNQKEGMYVNGEFAGAAKDDIAIAEAEALKQKQFQQPAMVSKKTPKIDWLTPASGSDETLSNEYLVKACVDSEVPLLEAKIFVNNSLQVASRGFSVDEEGDCKNVVERKIHLQPGENSIIVVAENEHGKAISEPISVYLTEMPRAETSNKSAQSRTALVIGNATYPKQSLRNSANDAVSMANALETMGFTVTLITDATQVDLKKAIRTFGNELVEKGGVGLFYYAGHGVQYNGDNYLLPVDAEIIKEGDIEFEAVNIGRLLVEMDNAKNDLNIVILDACRDNPYSSDFRSSSTSGLASISRAPTGTFIAYSTSPGSIASDGDGDNGLYTQELLKAIKTPNIRIEDVFKQVRSNVRRMSNGSQIPWENSSIEGDFFFIK
jgi:hypothetical protein